MDITLENAQASAFASWRKILRRLTDLNAKELSGGQYTNLSSPNFIQYGAEHTENLDIVLQFMLLDLPLDTATRQEILNNNIRDIVALDVLTKIPDGLFESHMSPMNQGSLKRLYEQRKEIKQNLLMFNPDERIHKQAEQHRLEMVLADIKDVESYRSTQLVSGAYLKWVCQALVARSVKDCHNLIQASNRVNLVFVENQVEVENAFSEAKQLGVSSKLR